MIVTNIPNKVTFKTLNEQNEPHKLLPYPHFILMRARLWIPRGLILGVVFDNYLGEVN